MASVKQGHVVMRGPDGNRLVAMTQTTWFGSFRLTRATSGPVSVSVTGALAAVARPYPRQSADRSCLRKLPLHPRPYRCNPQGNPRAWRPHRSVFLRLEPARTVCAGCRAQATRVLCLGIRVKRDSEVSVVYAEGLNSAKSSAPLQRADRHGILVRQVALKRK